ncbi:UDP-N-acetylmuramoyl-L-alanine--D-glutamate ligase [Caldimonas caldifontis]|uniref:UDP-N-acetylmuramoylalanine--D-glutamate ligase n=1 Tax=Caldimonas caldifontis TaxID=1452508 RepID=A0A2S5SZR8_9BURK|nr:UDP-N-acetylmuramoyl-L-alanine--D-glutamate ligase [Caldimonas caldifontis]PPE68182.1 UDP-N-acetylmuramoyl-L-alanine--D-glutamate ligase [Caldimonas caldifontis]
MKDLQGITVLVLGLGASGLAMVRWCVRCGAHVKVWDSREQPPQAATLRDELPQVELMSGALGPAHAEGVQRILKSPGLSPHDERLQGLLAEAARRGVPVQGELDLFAQALADLKAERRYAPQVVAITGTNGKTTTTAMTTLLIERTGRRVATAGNIGPTMLDTLGAALDREPEAAPADATLPCTETVEATLPPTEATLVDDDAEAVEAIHEAERHIEETLEAVAALGGEDEPAIRIVPPPPPPPVFEHLPDVWVLELSSFQLDGVSGFEPSAATVLNLSQDHLDWHGSMEAYAAAKACIFGREAVMVINRNDPLVEAMVPAPQTVGKGRSAKVIERQVVRFGLDAPTRPGDYGLVVEGGMAWLVRAMEADETLKTARRRKDDDADEELHIQRLMPADALRVRGRHNAANALAALALATAIGCPLAPMLHGLRDYAGEPHRVQHVATVGGVDYVDDSKGTNVGATVAALNGLGADRMGRRLLVILGGDGKGQDFSPLHEPVARHARFVALIGRDAAAIESVLAGTGVTHARFDSLEAAVRGCAERAESGDVVLMSPACASLDMFRNYGHRAEVFIASVHALAEERGELA